MELNSRRLVRQAQTAQHQARPVMWLALVAYHLDVHRPAGAARRDARRNVLQMALYLAVSADWRSGLRARPGRTIAAALAGLAERTVTRHWKLLEGLGAIVVSATPKTLNCDERAQVEEDPDERVRWYDRKEWRLAMPGWVSELTDEQIWPYVLEAATMINSLAVRAPGVDNHPAQRSDHKTVTPSLGFKVLTCVPVKRGTFSFVPKPTNRSHGTPQDRPRGRNEKHNRASRSSPKRRASRIRPAVPTQALILARELAADGRFPFLAGASMARVADELAKLPNWTIEDVILEVRQRLTECGKPMLAQVAWPPAYLAFLLADAVPDEPPAQIRAAAHEEFRAAAAAHQVAAANDYAQRCARAARPNSVARLEARRIAAAAASRSVAQPCEWPQVVKPGSRAAEVRVDAVSSSVEIKR